MIQIIETISGFRYMCPFPPKNKGLMIITFSSVGIICLVKTHSKGSFFVV